MPSPKQKDMHDTQLDTGQTQHAHQTHTLYCGAPVHQPLLAGVEGHGLTGLSPGGRYLMIGKLHKSARSTTHAAKKGPCIAAWHLVGLGALQLPANAGFQTKQQTQQAANCQLGSNSLLLPPRVLCITSPQPWGNTAMVNTNQEDSLCMLLPAPLQLILQYAGVPTTSSKSSLSTGLAT
jgi:hypothetical protein